MTDVTLIRTDEFDLRGEFLWFGVILHCDVFRWNGGVKKRLIEAIQSITRTFAKPIYAFQTPSHDPKKRKFIQLTGGVLDHYRYTPDGERAEMYLFRPLDLSKGK